MKNIVLLCCLVLLSGCATPMVTSRTVTNSPYAPVNERELAGGTVKYPSEGSPAKLAKRREDAYKKMYTQCKGPYRITSEYQKTEGDESYMLMGVIVHEKDEFTMIDFLCAPETAKN